MLQGVYRSFGDGEVCVRVLRLLLLLRKETFGDAFRITSVSVIVITTRYCGAV
jgi:hypothetical protein